MKEAEWEGFLLIKTYLQTIYSFTVNFLALTLITDGKESVCNVGDPGSIPGLERYPGEGNGSPLQYSCLENPMDRRVWSAIVNGVTKSQTWLKWLSTADILTETILFDSFLSLFYLSCKETWKSVLQIMAFQLRYFKSWKMMLWKCCTQYASKFGKLSRGHRTGKGQFSFQSQRKAMTKNAQTTAQLHSSHTLVK